MEGQPRLRGRATNRPTRTMQRRPVTTAGSHLVQIRAVYSDTVRGHWAFLRHALGKSLFVVTDRAMARGLVATLMAG